jgi:hypothetical protein
MARIKTSTPKKAPRASRAKAAKLGDAIQQLIPRKTRARVRFAEDTNVDAGETNSADHVNNAKNAGDGGNADNIDNADNINDANNAENTDNANNTDNVDTVDTVDTADNADNTDDTTVAPIVEESGLAGRGRKQNKNKAIDLEKGSDVLAESDTEYQAEDSGLSAPAKKTNKGKAKGQSKWLP